jgi:RNA polymerase sigma-70 factor (ECF subfamily)
MKNLYGQSEESPRSTEPNSCEVPEKEIIRQAQAGDAAAFEQLYRRYSKRIYRLCLHMVKNEIEAEDLTQEAFLRVFQKIHTFQGISAFSTWLHRVSVNTVLMSLRKKRRVEIPLENEDNYEEESCAPRHVLGGLDPSLSGFFDRENIKRALGQMPPGYKQVLVLHDVYGYEHNEIALLVKRSMGNSKSQLHKARVRMRSLL